MDVISAMNAILEHGSVPIALATINMDTNEHSMWTPRSLPGWLHSALSKHAHGMTQYPLNGEISN